MPKVLWQFRNLAGVKKAELLLYGNISDTSWWDDEVTPKQFAKDLDGLGAVSEIIVRINSGGGDVFAAQTIGNLLEQHPAMVTAQIDGLCASADLRLPGCRKNERVYFRSCHCPGKHRHPVCQKDGQREGRSVRVDGCHKLVDRPPGKGKWFCR